MRIDSHLNITAVQGIRPRGLNPLGGVREPGADSADFSSMAAEMRIAMDALKEAPEVREEQVAELRSQLEQGTFDPQLDALAEKLLG